MGVLAANVIADKVQLFRATSASSASRRSLRFPWARLRGPNKLEGSAGLRSLRVFNVAHGKRRERRDAEQHSRNQRFPAKAQRSQDNVEAILFSLCSFAPLRETFLQKQELANLLRRGRRGCAES